ncbi:hypothetical protein BN85400450 [Alteracholeplasma palmae J233]|uniref:Lipoprotein n=1 Tax=Alteracholeplasma palmae (strain ATCC 49389 / J233) TaxID=1318466 RepID=U4KJN2_ALTPJ|nr:hypothetical protein [Alteracholeplasma palmae]CCV63622.1 hypothetical protein BN85400450 [Alteracholeplasma palmae J233]
MKYKKIMILCITFLVTILASCAKKIDSDKEITFLNKNKAHIYAYKETEVVDTISSNFTNIEDISLSYDFISIVIDCSKYYQNMTKDFIEDLYNLLNLNDHIMVLFVDAKNYNFFESTPFANEKNYYENVSYVHGFYNFSSVKGIVEINYGLTFDGEGSKFKYAIISTFYRRVYNYIGAL